MTPSPHIYFILERPVGARGWTLYQYEGAKAPAHYYDADTADDAARILSEEGKCAIVMKAALPTSDGGNAFARMSDGDTIYRPAPPEPAPGAKTREDKLLEYLTTHESGTLAAMSAELGYPEASVSAGLRCLRKRNVEISKQWVPEERVFIYYIP